MNPRQEISLPCRFIIRVIIGRICPFALTKPPHMYIGAQARKSFPLEPKFLREARD
jgi:hypothetical protein